MKLEDEIKQGKKFGNEYERLLVNLLYTASWIESHNIQRLKPFGISPQQYNVLRILRGSQPNPLMLTEITARMIDKNSNATRLVEKLRTKGLVKREICSNNRRQVDIIITQAGLDLLTTIEQAHAAAPNQLANLTKAEALNINNLLDKLRG